MCNVTNHALQRYAERIKKVNKSEIHQTILDSKDLFVDELRKMYVNSKLIYQGNFNGNEIGNFRVADDICLILDTNETKIITLYRVDFGMGRKINKMMLEELLKELDEKEVNYLNAVEETRNEKDNIGYQILQLEEELESVHEQMKALKIGIQGLKEYEKTISTNEISAKTEMDRTAKKITYSRDYKEAMLNVTL